jgi:hypothetical protein
MRHLFGRVCSVLAATSELFALPSALEEVTVLAAKI